jgi:hypothetical protein
VRPTQSLFQKPFHRIPESQRHSTFVILPSSTLTSNGPHGFGNRFSASNTTYRPGLSDIWKRPLLSVVNVLTAPSSPVILNVAFGRGAAFADSNPFLIGPGRVGLTMTTPVIPVLLGSDSLTATDAHTIRNDKLTATTRCHIVRSLVSRNSLFQPKFFCESCVFIIEQSVQHGAPQLCDSCARDVSALLLREN